MKKLLTLLLALPLLWGHAAAQENAKYTILLTGASFASPQNGWFEIGCRQLDARAINRAIGGESIADTANRMAEGTLWNAGELDEMDALVIMQVHNRDVSATGGLKEKYTRQEHRLLERHSEPGHRNPAEPAPRPGHANHRRRRLRVASPAGPRQIHPAADGCNLYRHDAQNPAGKIESRP